MGKWGSLNKRSQGRAGGGNRGVREGRVAKSTVEVAVMAWNVLRAGISTVSQPSLCYPIILASRGVLSSRSFRPALCEQTGVQEWLEGGWLVQAGAKKGLAAKESSRTSHTTLSDVQTVQAKF